MVIVMGKITYEEALKESQDFGSHVKGRFKMKKILIFIVMLLGFTLLAGCSDGLTRLKDNETIIANTNDNKRVIFSSESSVVVKRSRVEGYTALYEVTTYSKVVYYKIEGDVLTVTIRYKLVSVEEEFSENKDTFSTEIPPETVTHTIVFITLDIVNEND